MLKWVAATSFIVAASLASGCGTFINHTSSFQVSPGEAVVGGPPPYTPYGGVQYSAQMSVRQAGWAMGEDRSYGTPDKTAAAFLSAGFLLIDLPISAVFDTVLLPYDLVQTLRRWRQPDSSPPPSVRLGQTEEPAPDNAFAELANNRFDKWFLSPRLDFPLSSQPAGNTECHSP